MIIKDLYKTQIECKTENDSCNATIDDDTITVTVILTDFNGVPVSGKDVSLKCDKGYFTQVTYNDGNTTLNKTKTTGGLPTKSDGSITATWTASEWGLCTFSANDANIQCNVTGYRTLNLREDGWVLRYSDHMASLEVYFTWGGNVSTGWSNPLTLVNQIPAKCYPHQTLIGSTSNKNIVLEVSKDGNIYYGNISSSRISKPSIRGTLSWLI